MPDVPFDAHQRSILDSIAAIGSGVGAISRLARDWGVPKHVLSKYIELSPRRAQLRRNRLRQKQIIEESAAAAAIKGG